MLFRVFMNEYLAQCSNLAVYGDMQLVWLMNDDKVHTQSQGNLLDFDITGILYANHCGNESVVDNTVFMRLNGTNQSADAIDSFHLAMWTDFDLGCHLDDYIGSLPARNSFYAYNENAIDGQGGYGGVPSFGSNVPIQTVTYLNQNLKYFIYYENGGTSPAMSSLVTSADYYKILTGKKLDGMPFTHNGTPVDFVYPGNPSNSSEWSMASEGTIPGDFRTLGTVELPTINPNDNFPIELAYITHNNVPLPAPNIIPIGNQIAKIQNYYDSYELNWDVYLGGNQELTIGQPLSLTANIEGGNNNANYTYSWSTGETTSTINATAPTLYNVTVTNMLTGCSKTDVVQVKFQTSTAEKATAIDKIAVFPNPVQGFIQIDISKLDNQNVNIQLVDITGRTVKTIPNEYSDFIRLDVSNVSVGVYFLSFSIRSTVKKSIKP